MDSFNPKLDLENDTTNQSLLACSWDWPPVTHNVSSGSPVPAAPVWNCHNANDDDDDGPEIDNPATPSTIAIVIPILYSLVCVVGLVGNVLVMYVIVRYTKMKTATNIYIFNLALADTLATSTLPFQIVNYFMSTWPFGRVLCKLIISIDYYNMFTSIFTLTMMSIDRYIAVCHPVRALDFRTPVKAKLVNICIWSLSSAIGLPVMIIAVTKQDKNGNVDCTLEFPRPTIYWDNMLKTCVFVFAFFIPVCVITVCYGLMITRLRSVRVLSGSKEKDRTMRRITRMVLVVVAAFVVCWTPIHLYVIVRAIVRIPESAVVTVSWHVCIALGYVNSSMNPFLYAFLDENFKRCFREFCFRRNFRLDLPSTSRVRSIAREASSINNLDGSNDNS